MYESINRFMLRTPVWPVDKFRQLQSAGGLQTSLSNVMDAHLLESIANASPALYKDLQYLEGDLTQRKTQQVITSVFKYISRMITRPTPFGLFSGVTVGELGNETEIQLLSTDQHQKRARPDMEWLLTIVEKLEDMTEGLQYVKVYASPLIYRGGGRLYLSYQTEYGKQTHVKSRREKVSIKASGPVLSALTLSKNPVLFGDLVREIAGKYSDAKEEQIKDFLLQLLKQEFLVSELRPSLTIRSPFQYIMDKIKSNPFYREIYHKMLEVDQSIKQLNETAVGEGLSIYQNTISKMEEINQTSSFLQIDLQLAKKVAVLHKEVAKEAAKAATILWRTAQTQKGIPHLKKYKDQFLDHYGRNREVPILELLSEEAGLGPPEAYHAEPKDENKEPRNSQREHTLLQLMQKALLHKEYTVKLDNPTLKMLEAPVIDESEAPLTLELYTEVLAKNEKAMDAGDFTLVIAPNPGSGSAGQTFGRFLDILDDSVRDELELVHQEQSMTQPHVIMADCVYFPTRGRAGNVSLAPGLQPYELVLGTSCANEKKQLELEDIVVGATLDRLYLKSVSLGKEVIFTANNMLNFQSSPALYRFLREVSLENFRIWHSFDWGTLRESPFLPRLQYERIILSPAKWKLSMEILGVDKEATDWEREAALKGWKQEWMVPRYVYLGSTDQRILIDLEQPEQSKLLMKEMMREGTVQLSESFFQEESWWLKGPNNEPFIGEFVFPLKKTESKAIVSSVSPTTKRTQALERLKLPGSDCLFLKLYMANSLQDEFISGPLSQFAGNIIDGGLADRWFFMRYADPEYHLRVRLLGNPDQLIKEVLPQVHQWARWCVKEGLLKKLMLDTYDPEWERYGGPDLMHHAEAMFEADSKLIANLIRQLRYRKTHLPEEVVACMNMMDWMRQFGLDFDEQFRWLDQIVKKDDYRKEFQPWRKLLVKLTLNEDIWGEFPGSDREEIVKLAKQRQEVTGTFVKEMERLREQGRLWNSPDSILGSLLHMTCNRLMGDNRKELKARAFTRHTLHSQQYLRKQIPVH